MKFYEFANLLYEVTGGDSKSAFVKTLFDAIIIENNTEAEEIIDSYSENSYKSYFYGGNNISGIASKLRPYLEPMEFVKYCRNFFSDEMSADICDKFRPYIPEINMFNFGECLADLFMKIIKKAATSKRSNSSKKNGENTEVETTEDVSSTNDETEQVEAQVLEDDKGENKNTIINQQANIIQNGPNNYNLTNNGVMNFNF